MFLCRVAVIVLCLFHVVPWVGLRSVAVIVAFPSHTHLTLRLWVGLWTDCGIVTEFPSLWKSK